MRRKEKENKVTFLGEAAKEVTGSMYLVEFEDKKILLECGLYQSSKNSYLDSYRVNSKKFKFRPEDIDYVFVCHAHVDHCGLLPRLCKEGFKGKIITTDKTALIMKELLLNSAYIVHEEARVLSKRFARTYDPIYTEDNVFQALDKLSIYSEYDTEIALDDKVSFKWIHNSHCVGAAQLQLSLTGQNTKKRILYTSDLGALNTENHFVDDTVVPKEFMDLVIMESTYGDAKRKKGKSRKFDEEKIRAAVSAAQFRKGNLLFPAFSFARTQELLFTLYRLFKDDREFDYEVVVDSVLSVDICKLYERVLNLEDMRAWREVMAWDRLRFIKKKEESMSNISSKKRQIVISSSGFCTNGRVVPYLQEYLKNENNIICFSGYVGDNSSYLSYRIKNGKQQSTITINHKPVKNKANCITLSSFSSHANRDDLIRFGSELNAACEILVHGSKESKCSLAPAIEAEMRKKNKTTRVIPSTKGMEFLF